MILHYLSLCPEGAAHFSEMLKDVPDITPRALSLKLTELAENGFIEKKVTAEPAVVISYRLTEKGRALTAALEPVQQWALRYREQ